MYLVMSGAPPRIAVVFTPEVGGWQARFELQRALRTALLLLL